MTDPGQPPVEEPPPRRRLRNRIGRRGAALLFFALLDLVYCYSLLYPPHPLPESYRWPATVMPLPVWALIWALVGLVCLVCAFVDRDSVAFTAAIAIKVGWGGVALFGWIYGPVERGYVSAMIWFAFGAFVYLIAGGIPAGGREWSKS